MSIQKIRTRLKCLAKDHLVDAGFELIDGRIARRTLSEVEQSIELQPGSGGRKGLYTVNLFSRYRFALDDLPSFQNSVRIGQLLDEGDIWYSVETEMLEQSFQFLVSAVSNYALPYLDRFSTIENLVDAVEVGELSMKQAFGFGVCWQHLHFSSCLVHLGQFERAKAQLNRVHEKYARLPEHEQRRSTKVLEFAHSVRQNIS